MKYLIIINQKLFAQAKRTILVTAQKISIIEKKIQNLENFLCEFR